MKRNKWICFFVLGLVFILFNLVFLFNNWSMMDDWQVFRMKDESVFAVFEIKAIDRFVPAYRMFFWCMGRVSGRNVFVLYLAQNILLLVSLITLYNFTHSLTKNRKISVLVLLVFLSTTSFGENYCRLGTPQSFFLPFFILLMVISFDFIFRNGTGTNLILIGLLFFLSLLTNESAVFILLSFFAFFILLWLLREKVLLKRTLYVSVCLFVAFVLRMMLFFSLGGEYFTGKGYGNSIFGFSSFLTSLLHFPYRCPIVAFLILSGAYLYLINKRRKLLTGNDELQLVFMALFALFPLLILFFWRSGPRAYLLLPFIPPILIIFAKLYTLKCDIRRVVIPAALFILMLGGNLLNIRFFVVFFSRNNAYQNMLSYVSEITAQPGQRVLLGLDRGGWIETYNATYFYLKNRYEKQVYIGSFVPVFARTIFLYWDKSLVEEGLESFKSEKEDVIEKNDIIITFSGEPIDFSSYYHGEVQFKKKFESITWMTNLSQLKKGNLFDREYWSVYVAL